MALVRDPGPELDHCALTYLARDPIDVKRARAQHAAYVACLESLGLTVEHLPRLPDCPDATFVEDAAIVLEEVAVLPRMGDDRRRAESASMRAALEGRRELIELSAPTTLDGGDVLVIDDMLYIGQSKRTNHAALKSLAHALLGHGYMVKAVEVLGCLHLKTACTSLGDQRVLANPQWIDMQRMRGLDVVEVHPDEPFGANVVRIEDTLLASASHPRTNASLERLGYDVRALEIDELEKAEAGLTCLSVLFRTPPY